MQNNLNIPHNPNLKGYFKGISLATHKHLNIQENLSQNRGHSIPVRTASA